MTLLPGVFMSTRKNGQIFYRASITFKNKHISLGSYDTEQAASQAYMLAKQISTEPNIKLDDYHNTCALPFHKWIVLHNFRDNHYYFKNPIYLKANYFVYYFDEITDLKFDVDDLFYYSTHKIMRRNGYLFVNDYGMQTNILSRYGIKNFAVEGRDYYFKNGDTNDFRYGNIEIINRYYGVLRELFKGKIRYTARIHINGNYIIGRYDTEEEAAVAYNKAIDLLKQNGNAKEFNSNYVLSLNDIEYANLYHKVKIADKLRKLTF